MPKRIIIAVSITLVLSFLVPVMWNAESNERDGDTASNIVAANDAPTGADAADDDKPKKKGNRVARWFKAPFKAVSKVLGGGSSGGGGRDDDGNKLARMTERDGARFESVGVQRVDYDRDERRRGEAAGVSEVKSTAREHLANGHALLESGRLNEAIAELSRAASIDPTLSRAHSLLAVAFDRKGLREQAKKFYDRAVESSPEDAQALNNLGYSLYLSGNYRGAVDRLKRAARLAPDDKRILNNLALAQCRLGKYDDAYKNFARAGGEFSGHMNTASLAERAGRDEAAIKHLEAARRLQPASSVILRRLIDLYQRNGHDDHEAEARRALIARGELATAK